MRRPIAGHSLGSSFDDEDAPYGHEGVTLRSPKTLYRLFERVFKAANDQHGGRRLLAWCLREFHVAFRDELGLRGVWLYSAHRSRFHLVEQIGQCEGTPPAELDGARPAVRYLIERGLVCSRDPGALRALDDLSVTGAHPAVAMLIAEPRARHLVLVSFRGAFEPATVEFVLSTLRSVLSARILQNRWGDSIREAAEIQRGLLPEKPPEFPGFDIAGRSVPAEDVGGDLYDFLEIGPTTLGLAVADASGHGLGAALVARDVSVGLRMGAGGNTTATHLLSQLNRVVHASGMANSFVSTFYGELDMHGNLLYVNAGHPSPLLLHAGGIRELSQGNVVLGPKLDARFQHCFEHIEPGAMLMLYTDGIIERQNARGEMFETGRLQEAAQRTQHKPAIEMVDAIFAAADTFGSAMPWDDDATVVVVKRDGAAPNQPGRTRGPLGRS